MPRTGERASVLSTLVPGGPAPSGSVGRVQAGPLLRRELQLHGREVLVQLGHRRGPGRPQQAPAPAPTEPAPDHV